MSNAIQTIDNEANHLIIYCIRHGRNATYEPGLKQMSPSFGYLPCSFPICIIRNRSVGITYGLLTKCKVKMAGYWPSSFFACLWTETKARSINSQKRTRPISSYLDRTNLINKGFIIWHLANQSAGYIAYKHYIAI